MFNSNLNILIVYIKCKLIHKNDKNNNNNNNNNIINNNNTCNYNNISGYIYDKNNMILLWFSFN